MDLPIPSEEDKKKYITDVSALPVPEAGSLPVPTEAQKAQYVSSVSDLPVPPSSTIDSVEKEVRDRSFFNRPVLDAEETRKAEIQAIAEKNKVDPRELESLAPYFGARVEGTPYASVETAKRAVGAIGEAALGIPQKIYKMTQSPEKERALDQLQALAEGRQSWLQKAAEIAVPVGPAATGAKTLGRAALEAASIGSVAGVAGSKQGQELEGAATGAVLGGALGGAISKIANRASTKVEKEITEDVARKSAPDIEKGAEEILSSRSQSLPELEQRATDVVRFQEKAKDIPDEVAEVITKEQVHPEVLERALDSSTPEGQLYRQRAVREMPEVVQEVGPEKAVQRVLAGDVVEKDTREFAEYLTSKPAKTLEDAQLAIDDWSQMQGGKAALADQYSIFSREKAATDFVTDNYVRAGMEGHAVNRAGNTLSDAQFVLRDIDNRAGGLGLEPVHREINRQLNRMSYPRQAFRKDLDRIYRTAKGTGVDDTVTSSSKIYDALDTGDFSGLSRDEMDVAQAFRDYFRKGLDFVNRAVKEGKGDESLTPLSIKARENYVPYRMLPARELEGLIDRKLSGLPDLSTVTDKVEFQKLLAQSPELREVSEGMAVLDSMGPAQSGPQLLSRIGDLFGSKEGRKALETRAVAAMERGEENLPKWMRETNLYKLADSWSANTLKHLYLRKPIDQMASKLRTLRRIGAETEAGYVQNLLADMQGLREGTFASYTAGATDRYHKVIDGLLGENPSPVAQAAAAAAKTVPEILSDLNKQIYPNLLGLSPRAILMNATQPVAKTLPEIGFGPYGASALVRGAASAILNFRRQVGKVGEQGLMPAEFVGKYRRAVADGIRRSSLYALPQEALNHLADMSLYLYTRMDALNRSITLSTAEVIAHDLVSGRSGAQKVLSKLPGTVRKALASAGSEEEAARILASHLNASTQYNYNRASLSEFGRTMGPFFSTFTKWPTATAGEILSEYREKGFTKGTLRSMEKFAAPLVLFMAVDKLIKSTAGDNEGNLTDRQQYFLGKGGLASSSPIGSLGAIAKGDFFTPPAVDAILKGAVEPAMKGDTASLRKGLASAIQNFTPGSVYIRFLTQDLVTLLTGHKPEGSDFLEKSEEGARQLNREVNR